MLRCSLTVGSLKQILAGAKLAIDGNPSHAILGYYRFEVDKKGRNLIVTSFNLAIGIEVTMPIEEGVTGSLCIPAAYLNAIAESRPNDEATIKFEEFKVAPSEDASQQLSIIKFDSVMVRITCGKYRSEVKCAAASEYPEIHKLDKEAVIINLDKPDWDRGVEQTQFACSTDQTKQVLTGVNFQLDDNIIHCGATNGHRLSTAKIRLSSPTGKKFDITIPYASLSYIGKLLRQFEAAGGGKGKKAKTVEQIKLRTDGKFVEIEFNQVRVVSRLLEGQYPNYPQLIPTHFVMSSRLEVPAFLLRLKGVKFLAENRAGSKYTIEWDFRPDDILIAACSEEFGLGEEELSAVHTMLPHPDPENDKRQITLPFQSFSTAFNIQYLLDWLEILSAQKVSHVTMKLCQNQAVSRPVIFEVDEDHLYLVMPIQLKNGTAIRVGDTPTLDSVPAAATEPKSKGSKVVAIASQSDEEETPPAPPAATAKAKASRGKAAPKPEPTPETPAEEAVAPPVDELQQKRSSKSKPPALDTEPPAPSAPPAKKARGKKAKVVEGEEQLTIG